MALFSLGRVRRIDIRTTKDESRRDENQKEPRRDFQTFCIFSDVFHNIRKVCRVERAFKCGLTARQAPLLEHSVPLGLQQNTDLEPLIISASPYCLLTVHSRANSEITAPPLKIFTARVCFVWSQTSRGCFILSLTYIVLQCRVFAGTWRIPTQHCIHPILNPI